jgi:beta-lactamase class A
MRIVVEKRCRMSLHATFSRRLIARSFIASLAAGCAPAKQVPRLNDHRVLRLQALEASANGRLGVCVIDCATGATYGWRKHDRFSHCSSFKMSLAAMLLAQSEKGIVDLNERLYWTRADLLGVSPITEENVDAGLSVAELAKATLVTSDNAAANVLMRRFGGPNAVTQFWRSIGDQVSRLDRYEPELNEPSADEGLDTTTPHAIAKTTMALVEGNALSPTNRALLKSWMIEVRTGARRIRAGFPFDWVSGDKTGTGISAQKHTYVDIAFGGPRGRAPLIISAYFEPKILAEPMDPVSLATLAEVGRIAALGIGA